tara:strand:- start:462 stop:1091 length:630 start_codon:yes stop_codon:yes gene_type:complete
MNTVRINMSFLDIHDKITFNQALLLLNGLPPNIDKLEDEELTRIYKPSQKKAKFIRQLREDNNTDIANIELKRYQDLIKMYNILVAAYGDASPTEPTIPSQDFKKWALKKGFITRIFDEKLAKQLYKPLKDAKAIDGEFHEKWKWNLNRNELSYLATKLKHKRILGANCHKELANLIQDPSFANKQLKNVAGTKKPFVIDNLVEQIIKG